MKSEDQNSMSSENTSVPHNWKRQLSTGSETDPRKLLLSPPLTKRPKLKHKQLSRTTPSFADNRSKNSFTCQALQEFDRRTVWPAALLPPDRSGEGNICLAQFKRFAKHGGPSLTDLRAVSYAPTFSSNSSKFMLAPRPSRV